MTLVSQPVKDFTAGRAGVSVELGDGSTFAAKLLVAADGARSRLRERAGIAVHGWSYGQSAIVTTVAHERDHHGRAEEHFLPGGPFAILPLRHNRSSIVWTERTADAERFVALPDAEFHDELEKRFGLHLGDITLAGPRRAYPLGLWVARSFIAERMALVGDAAHVIHPIAGQGLNMGLRDIAALAEAVVDGARLGLDPGDATVLERYQRWRRFDTHDHERLDRCAQPAVLQPLRRAAARPRHRPRPGRPPAAAQAHVHARGRGAFRRGAEAAAGRGAVKSAVSQGGTPKSLPACGRLWEELTSAECSTHGRGTPAARRSRHTSARNS